MYITKYDDLVKFIPGYCSNKTVQLNEIAFESPLCEKVDCMTIIMLFGRQTYLYNFNSM